MIIYLISMMYLIVCTCCQYICDFKRLKIEQYEPLNSSNNTIQDGSNRNHTLHQLHGRLEHYRSILYNLGVPQMRMQFAPQILYLINFFCSSLTYFLGKLIFKYLYEFDAYLINLLFGSKREERIYLDLLDKYLEILTEPGSLNPPSISVPMEPRTREAASYCTRNKEVWLDLGPKRNLVVDAKNQKPYNLRDHWKESQWKLLHTIHIVELIYFQGIITFIFGSFLYLIDMDNYQLNVMNIFFFLATFTVVMLGILGFALHVTVQTFSCLDQMRLAQRLRQDFLQCIRININLFERLYFSLYANSNQLKRGNFWTKYQSTNYGIKSAGTTSLNELLQHTLIQQIKHEMSSNLLMATIQYQIFIIQARRLKCCLRFVLLTALPMTFMIPILVHSHMPYFEAKFDKTVRMATILLSITTIVPVNFFMIPYCAMHAHFLKLYRSLYMILAHTAHLQAVIPVYDQRLISIIRTELDRPQGIANQYGTNFAFMHFDYSKLVKLHFYFGFLVIVIIVETQKEKTKLSRPTDMLLGKVFGGF